MSPSCGITFRYILDTCNIPTAPIWYCYRFFKILTSGTSFGHYNKTVRWVDEYISYLHIWKTPYCSLPSGPNNSHPSYRPNTVTLFCLVMCSPMMVNINTSLYAFLPFQHHIPPKQGWTIWEWTCNKTASSIFWNDEK